MHPRIPSGSPILLRLLILNFERMNRLFETGHELTQYMAIADDYSFRVSFKRDMLWYELNIRTWIHKFFQWAAPNRVEEMFRKGNF